MRKTFAGLTLGLLAAGCQPEQAGIAPAPASTPAPTAAQAEIVTTPNGTAMLYDLDFNTITGEPLPFSRFEGKAVLVVNTASRCGFTRQYEGLQALWSGYRDKGLVVLGVPSNDFGGQEPGTEAEVKSFCEINYGVDFPLTEKTTVVGTGRHPFYAGLEDALGEPARPKWNFHKVLVGRDGTPLKAFPSSVEPDAPELIAAIDQALAG
ncbi:MAG: glutathione peroxidase [Pseudomonadota bacterium]